MIASAEVGGGVDAAEEEAEEARCCDDGDACFVAIAAFAACEPVVPAPLAAITAVGGVVPRIQPIPEGAAAAVDAGAAPFADDRDEEEGGEAEALPSPPPPPPPPRPPPAAIALADPAGTARGAEEG